MFSKANRRITTLDLRRADFGLLGDMLGGIPWDVVLERRGVQESSLIFRDYFLQAQEPSFPHVQETKQRWQETCMDE